MAAWFASPAVAALGLVALVTLGYASFRAHEYRRLREKLRQLRDLKVGQRRLYRGLESCRAQLDDLSIRVPHAVRPAPYTEDDRRAIDLRAGLLEAIGVLHQKLRPLQVMPCPSLTPAGLLTNRYALALREVEQELALARELRQDLGQLEMAINELESVLARLAEKPLEARRAFAELQEMAAALSEEIDLERRAGTESLVALLFEAQAVRATAAEWEERVRSVAPDDAAPVVVEAEAQRPRLQARLTGLYREVGAMAGIHDHAHRGLERLTAVLSAADERLAALRPALARALRPRIDSAHQAGTALRARYDQRDPTVYSQIAREAWTLVAQVHSLDKAHQRLAEADRRAWEAVSACRSEMEDLQRQVVDEEAQVGLRLDLVGARLSRAEDLMAQMQRMALGEDPGGLRCEPEAILALLADVQALATTCRGELDLARQSLEDWRSQWSRLEELLSGIEAAADQRARVARAWQDLQVYDPANWVQVDSDSFDAYCREYDAVLAEVGQVRAELGSGQVLQSGLGALLGCTEQLAARWERVQQDRQRIMAALSGTRACERQVQEGIAAVRPEVEAVEALGRELPSDEDVADLRALGQALVDEYRRLEDEVRRPDVVDLRRLRDEGLARLHEQLAMFRLSHTQLAEEKRAALKQTLASLWERWEALNQRLAKAEPATGVDRRGLAQRWEALVREARNAPTDLRPLFELGGRVDAFGQDLGAAEQAFQSEREQARQAEAGLASARRAAAQVRESLPRLLSHPHPLVVDEEWERSTKAWRRAESMVRHLEPQRGVEVYIARLDEAVTQYREARARAHSALVRILRYAFLEDPDGMHEACLPLGRRWGRLGVTTRESHIRNLLGELEGAGQLQRLVERVSSYFAKRVVGED